MTKDSYNSENKIEMVQAFIVILFLVLLANHVQAIKVVVLEVCETGRVIGSPLFRTEAGCHGGSLYPVSSYLTNCENNTLQLFSDSACKVLRGQLTLGECRNVNELGMISLPKLRLGVRAICKNVEPPLLEAIAFYDSTVCMINSSHTLHSLGLPGVCLLGPSMGSQKTTLEKDSNKVTSEMFDSTDCTGHISRSESILLNSCILGEGYRPSLMLMLNYGDGRDSSLKPVSSMHNGNNMGWIIVLGLFLGMLCIGVARYQRDSIIERNHSVTLLKITEKQEVLLKEESLL